MTKVLDQIYRVRDTLKDAVEFLEYQVSTRGSVDFIAAKMPHELRTPLNGLVGIITIYENQFSHMDTFNDILRLTTNLVLAIDNIIILLQLLESNTKPVEFPGGSHLKLDIELLMSLIASKLELELRLADVSIDTAVWRDGKRVDGDEVHIVVKLDKHLLSSIMLDIAMTAIRRARSGTVVSMKTCVDGNRVEFSVTCKTLTKDVPRILEQIMSPYIDDEPSQCSGFELSLVSRLSEVLGGFFELTFKADGDPHCKLAIVLPDTEFWIETQTATRGIQPVSVLVVEDNQVSLMIIEKYLTRLGHQYQTATTGMMAIDALRSRKFDVILLDLGLPDMSGLKVCEYLELHESHTENHTKILVVTAEEHAQTPGSISGYLRKPLYLQDLKSEIERVTSTEK